MTTYTATHPASITRFLPGGESAHSVTRFLNSTTQSFCENIYLETIANTDQPACQAYVNCILENLDEYAKAGISAGTQLLTLVPVALAFLPSFGPDVWKILTIPRTPVGLKVYMLLLGGFCGLIPMGKSLSIVRDIVREEKSKSGKLSQKMKDSGIKAELTRQQGLKAVQKRWDKAYSRDETRMDVSSKTQWTLLAVSTCVALVIIYASIVIGLLGIVTWACNRQMLVLSWIIVKVVPVIAEVSVLSILRMWLSHAGQNIGNTPASTRTVGLKGSESQDPSEASLLPRSSIQIPLHHLEGTLDTLAISLKVLEYAIVLWGTAVLGSTIMIDGIPCMVFLLLLPALYGVMQLCVFGAVKETPEYDEK